jgi:hypothetical protein
MANAGWQPYNERQPFGKGATVISPDNISHAEMRRAARTRIERGRGTPEDYEMVAGAEAMIQKAVQSKIEEEQNDG